MFAADIIKMGNLIVRGRSDLSASRLGVGNICTVYLHVYQFMHADIFQDSERNTFLKPLKA